MHLRAVSLCPAPNRGVINGQTAFRHEFFHVPEAQAESEIPAHAGDDHLGLELALPEQRWPARLHPVNLPDPQMQHFRAGLYARVSTNDQQSLTMQNRAMGSMLPGAAGQSSCRFAK